MLNKGTVLTGRYEIIERVGTGGMADVYRAMDSKLNRYVAIKVLKREYREDEQFVTKFRQEARSVAGLSHPNVVGVYDVGNEGDIQFIVLELVEGITLKKYIEKKGHLPYKEALSIAIQVANGMEAAHAHHIVHRDIKPQNIIISKEGKVKVTDFGIAKAASSTTTVSTSAMGSVHYMSPEQARGGYSDERSDIYSFGITLFEMLTGEVPFDGDTTVAVAVHHIQDEIMAPSQKMDGIPSSVDQIVQKCTRKKTDQRYQSAEELIADLKRALQDPEGDFVKVPPVGSGGKAEEVPGAVTETDISGTGIIDDIEDEGSKRSRRVDSVLKWIGIGIAAALALVIVFFSVRYAQTGSIFGKAETTEATEETVEQVRVPDVVGKTVEEATKTLEEAGFIVKSEAETGEIGSQNPAANSVVDKGSTVRLELVKPTTAEAKSKKLPDLIGLTEDEAIAKINELTEDGYELNYKINYEYNEAPFGDVIDMSPKADEEVKDGRTINLTISRGEYTTEATTTTTLPPTTTAEPTTTTYEAPTTNAYAATVPRVVGLSESEAISALSAAGLTYNVRYSSDADGSIGNVVYQQPYSGDVLDKGSTVTITVKSAPETTAESYDGGGESSEE